MKKRFLEFFKSSYWMIWKMFIQLGITWKIRSEHFGLISWKAKPFRILEDFGALETRTEASIIAVNESSL
jgi:hypothetical protein